jgi:hypothetical protein
MFYAISLHKNSNSIRPLAVACCLSLGTTSLSGYAAAPSDIPLPPFGAVSPDRQLLKRPIPSKHVRTTLPADTEVHAIIVKFTEGSNIRLRQGVLTGGAGYDIGSIYRLPSYKPEAVSVSRVFRRPQEELDEERKLAQHMSGWELADLNLYYRFGIDPKRINAAALIDDLNTLDTVEIAYAKGKTGLTVAVPDRHVQDCFPTEFAAFTGGTTNNPPPSWNYQPLQLYLGNQGIRATTAWNQGNRGQGITIVDIENDWLNHEAYNNPTWLVGWAPSCKGCNTHGAAAVGMLSAFNNNYGVVGIAGGATARVASANNSAGLDGNAYAVSAGTANTVIGDLILTEIAHRRYYTSEIYFPLEDDEATYNAIRTAVALGRVVVEGAGNSSTNLDDYDNFTTGREDSGAIIVGAGTATGRLPITGYNWGSSYGSRVNVQGWGECIVTSGYSGELYSGGSPETSYTGRFGGTSGAAAMVAGAAALIQSHFISTRGSALNSFAMRHLLINTGTPQAGEFNIHIGPLPDVAAALNAQTPSADITANGLHGSVSVPVGTAVNLTVSFDAGDFGNTPADWWVADYYNGQYFYLVNGVWQLPPAPIAQAPLVDLPPVSIYSAPLAGTGLHSIYAGTDLFPNAMVGAPDTYEPLFHAAVNVTVQ